MKVVKEVETTTGKLSRGEETLGHVLVGKGSEVLPFHLNEVDICSSKEVASFPPGPRIARRRGRSPEPVAWLPTPGGKPG